MNIADIKPGKMYTIKEVAEMIGCHENTLYNAIRSKKLISCQTGDRAKHRIAGFRLLEFLEGKSEVRDL